MLADNFFKPILLKATVIISPWVANYHSFAKNFMANLVAIFESRST